MPDLKFGKGEKNQTDAADYVFCSDPLKSLSTLLGTGKRRKREGVMRLSILGAYRDSATNAFQLIKQEAADVPFPSDRPARGKPTLC